MRLKAFGLVLLSLIAAGCGRDLPYFLSIAPHAGDTSPNTTSSVGPDNPQPTRGQAGCTVYLDGTVRQASFTTPQAFQLEFERTFAQQLKALPPSCLDEDHIPPDGAAKWMAGYSLEASDPDDDLDRLQEDLRSMLLVKSTVKRTDSALRPEEAKTEPKSSRWCGEMDQTACPQESHRLYKLYSCHSNSEGKLCGQADETDSLEQSLLDEIALVRLKGERDTRFLVLGYEIPWDREHTRIRYGIILYFIDRRNPVDTATQQAAPQQASAQEAKQIQRLTGFIGYTLAYTNEATAKPKFPGDKERTQAALSWWERGWYTTGYPIAVAIGLKNAAFELTKMPFSSIAGALFGRGHWWEYPAQNIWNAGEAIAVEAGNLPAYGIFPAGVYNLMTEVPFVGQLFQFNFGPEHPTSESNDPCSAAHHKIFLSRGIYGGNPWEQDTGLWAGWMQLAYPDYDIYSPPYEHGTVTDVGWSMFNLSHGPAYNEARYVIAHAGDCDRLYLAGHSGGVQRSTVASRILGNHGYNVDKVLGVAGPSVGQAFVDSRRPHAFRILLNPGIGPNDDVTSKIGMAARLFSTTLDLAVWTVPKYTFGYLASIQSDQYKDFVYNTFDHIGFSNAEITDVPRRPSTRHVTPLDLSLREPIVFDAYVRSEMATAFRTDLERPSGPNTAMPKVFRNVLDKEWRRSLLQFDQKGDGGKDGFGAFPWRR